jgi:hypothetical protein
MTSSKNGATSCAMPAPFRQALNEINIGKLPFRCGCCSGIKTGWPTTQTKADYMSKFFFDMKDGVPMRDRIGLEFRTNAEAIAHCGILAEHFYRDSLTDDQNLEISVVNALGREIHRQFVHRR